MGGKSFDYRTCERCNKYPQCFGFAAEFGRCTPAPQPEFDPGKVEKYGYDGLVERPRVPFDVLDI